ncbi:hypothetical protein C5167_012415 [Papaver somniferum]|uniref:Uncharacterized protein n=1 Tax=Papaver somniferum TaxID=3469 RepID=A0A4Y7IXE8_PAPSO|nr:hypothetical protein C5167_012415 [Papaver somniferum]
MKKYFRKNRFHEDIQNYDSLYVFCVSFAKLESPMESLANDNYKVYFAPNKALAYSVGLMLDNDNYGVLLTNKTEDEVLSKFREYREFDFINAGSTPMETLVFEKDEIVMPLPPVLSAKKLCPKLKKLGMPVELSGGLLCYSLVRTLRFVVCEVKKRVTENAAKILFCFLTYSGFYKPSNASKLWVEEEPRPHLDA